MIHRLLPLLLCLLPLASCVTSGDLRSVSDSVARLEGVLDDETKTTRDVEAAIAQTKQEIEQVARNVEERTQGVLDGLTATEALGGGGLLSLLTGVGLNMYRDSRRRQRGERTGTDSPSAHNAG